MGLKCAYVGKCSGCEWISRDFSLQAKQKVEHLEGLLAQAEVSFEASKIEFLGTKEFRTRDRVDLIAKNQNGKLSVGLYDLDRKEIVDIESCPQMSENLEKWFFEFRKTIPQDLKIGSFRLRVAPNGLKGVWLDLPNIEVKEQLEKEVWFKALLNISVVEVGQKRKRLYVNEENKLKLGDPRAENWFETYVSKTGPFDSEDQGEIQSTQTLPLKPSPLKSLIGGFSQPGFDSNKILVSTILKQIQTATSKTWVELGCGSGNLTLPLASFGFEVHALELDEQAIESLKVSAKEAGYAKRIRISKINFHKPTDKLKDILSEAQGLLVDPPRSGIQGTLDVLLRMETKPSEILYVSCFPESFASDLKKLTGMGYKVEHLSIVDQFPQTPHYEIVSKLTL